MREIYFLRYTFPPRPGQVDFSTVLLLQGFTERITLSPFCREAWSDWAAAVRASPVVGTGVAPGLAAACQTFSKKEKTGTFWKPRARMTREQANRLCFEC